MTSPPLYNEKKISLCISNEGLSLFLMALLKEWGFIVSTNCPTEPSTLLLTEDNNSICAGHDKQAHLISSTYIDNNHVNIPIILEQLWKVLERHFHRTPRYHLRLAVDYPITMTIRGTEYSGHMNSLSPAGGRLTLPRELAIGERFPIVLPLQQQTLHLSAKVIYVATFVDSNDRYDAGVLFERTTNEEKTLLHDTILLSLLTSIRPHIPRWAFEIGINQCELSPALRKEL